MKKRFAVLLAMTLAATTLFAGCGGSEEEKAGQKADTEEKSSDTAGDNIVVVADTQASTSLDLAQSWDSWYTTRWGITETLYMLDENLEPYPWLAESCEMKDDTTWVITLRDDVTFQNGNKLTAESVKKCWERTAGINARFNEVLYIDKMTADGQTLTVTTTKKVPAFLNGLCEPLTGIIDVSAT